MTLKLSSFDTVSKLYLKKHEAKLKNDTKALKLLKKQYFDTIASLMITLETYLKLKDS